MTDCPDAPPAEHALLAAVYHAPALYLDFEWLPAGAFTSAPHSAVWAGLGLLVADQRTLDRANWETILQNDPRWLLAGPVWAQLAATAPVYPAPAEYAATIAEAAKRRALRRAAAELDQLAQDASVPLDAVLAQAEDAVLGVTGATSGERAVTPLRTILERIWENLEAPEPVKGWSTGLEDLDRLTGGGRAGQLWVVTAPTGAGKTTLAMTMASAVANAGGVVYVASLEMTEDEIGQDQLARRATVDSALIRDAALSDRDMRRVMDALGPLSEWGFYVDDSEDLTLRTLTHRARRLRHRAGRLSAIVVDYIQLLLPDAPRKGQTREQELAEIANGLKRLAKRLDCWVIVPSQLNDEGQVRDSRMIGMAANVHVTIETDLDPKTLNPETPLPAKLVVRKARGGGLGAVNTVWHLPTHQFRPVTYRDVDYTRSR